jgi:Putative peptidoglycan binding domain
MRVRNFRASRGSERSMRRLTAARQVLLAALLLGCLTSARPAAAAVRAPAITSVRCVRACLNQGTVEPGGLLRITGVRFSRGLRAVYQVSASGRRRSVATRVLTRTRVSAPVPADAVSGVLYVRDRAGRRSNRARALRVVRPSLTQSATLSGTAFDGSGMWIWYVSKSSGGDAQAIVTQAQQHGVSTVFVKSSDGTTAWSQFSSQLIAALKGAGLKVCAWQYVYGDQPEAEAQLGAQAVALGADCLVIDAESEYEGRYAQAQRYITALRQAIGPAYPVGLTSFPYVDYHPALPYSVFLGPGAAQFNLPQIYWKEIGGGLDAVLDHAYRFNRIYGRPIDPLGQLYDAPSSDEVLRYRELAAAEGSAGVSWWDWQDAQPAGWDAISQPLAPPAAPVPSQDDATYAPGGKGDPVVWAQEHLNGAGQFVAVTGNYDPATQQAVSQFQGSVGLPATGTIDTATWTALLKVTPVMVDWTAPAATASKARAARRRGHAPWSARLKPRRDEIRPHGRG